jgi:hypothetical protein
MKTLDPDVARALLEGFTDELTPQRKTLDAFYRQFKCLRCQGAVQRETVPGHAFSDPDTLVARSILRCAECDFVFDPHTGLALNLGEGFRS